MEQEIETRLAELRRELGVGEEQLALLDERRLALERTMLRIAGAIQVLEELAAAEAAEPLEASA